MSFQRVIQDSDDEDEDARSEMASSCDPLQDSSYAPRTDAGTARVDDSHPDFQIPFPSTDPPQVDFDRFLRSESSIMAGDYEDERWVSTANSNSAHVVHAGNGFTEQLRDDSFLYTVNAAANNVSDMLPPTADTTCDTAGDDFDHPSKRRRVSPTQEKSHRGPEKSTDANSSYNYFASSGPNEPSQTATLLLPLTTYESHGATPELNPLPIPGETPPPTIPFSEDTPYEQGQVTAEANPEHEIQETDPRQPLSETDAEALSMKKKRGRPKKQPAGESAGTEAKAISDDIVEVPEQSAKKKPGRPKKQENDTAFDQPQTLDPLTDGVPEISHESILTSSVSKESKKKIKRSKTTSDIPNKPGESKAESDVLWIESRPIEGVQVSMGSEKKPVSHDTEEKSTDKDTTKEQPADEKTTKAPKKRGRKRKETADGPAVSVENQNVLQDISNIPPAPPQDKEKPIDTEMKTDNPNSGVDETGASNPDETPKTPKNRDPTSAGSTANPESDEGNTCQETKIETPTVKSAVQSAKQTPISNGKVPFRVGLSRRARIAPLLKVVRK